MVEIENINKEQIIKEIENLDSKFKGNLVFTKDRGGRIFPDLKLVYNKDCIFLVSDKLPGSILGVYNEKRKVFYTYIFYF